SAATPEATALASVRRVESEGVALLVDSTTRCAVVPSSGTRGRSPASCARSPTAAVRPSREGARRTSTIAATTATTMNATTAAIALDDNGTPRDEDRHDVH